MKRLKKTIPFAISLTVHAVAAILLSFNLATNGGSGNSDQKQENGQEAGIQGQNDQVVPKQVEVELVEPPEELLAQESEVEVPKEEEKKPEEGLTECENDMWYGGIGVSQDWQTGTLQEVYAGYPADQIGLKVGDQLLSVDGFPDTAGGRIRGEPGTPIEMKVFRPSTNEYLTFTFKRDKICLGKKI